MEYSAQFSHSVLSDYLWPHGLQHTSLLCPPLSPRVCSDSRPLNQWCYLTTSFSVAPFSFCLQSFQASGPFPVSWLFPSGSWPKYWGFSISASNEYSGLISFRIDWFDLLVVQGILGSLFQHHNSKASIIQCSAFFMTWLSHPNMKAGKTIVLTIGTFVGKGVSDVSVF